MRVSVIDIGSNTVKMSVFEREAGENRHKEIFRSSIPVGLYSYISAGELSKEGIDSLVSVVLQLKEKAKEYASDGIRAFATAAVRMSRNRDLIVSEILSRTGIAIDVLNGLEEASYTYLGAVLSMPKMPEKGISVDLGGASTEITRFGGGKCLESVSVKMGALSVFTQEVNNLLPSKAEWVRLNKYVSEMLLQHEFIGQGGEVLLIGGSARVCAKLFSKSENVTLPCRISVKDMQEFVSKILDGDKRAQLDLLRASPERVHLMMPAMCIFLRIAKKAGAQYLIATNASAREGYASRLFGEKQ